MYLQDCDKFQGNVLKKTPEGYLSGRICVTGAGVFRYLDNAGKLVGRLRSVDEVQKATASLNGKPVTLLHPSDEVNPENAKSLSVGMSATDASFDGLNNFVTITITDKSAIDAIEKGEVKAISCGYTCDVSDDVGVWQGAPHQQKQSDITYNHIALVKEGRAGDQVRFRVGDSVNFQDFFNKQKGHDMKTINLDGVDYQADEKVIHALQDAKSELAKAQENVEKLNADNDALREELEEEFNERLQDALDSKMKIIDTARGFGIEVKSTDSVENIYKKVVEKAFDSVDFKEKDASYINAMYDAACMKLEKDAKETPKTRNTTLDDVGGGCGYVADAAHDKMVEDLVNCVERK